jgi:hypothetical protein
VNIGAAFPSTYLKAADLAGRTVTVTMEHVRMEDIGDDHKPVLYFKGKEKGLVLNKTNGAVIAELYGDETDQWMGEQIEIFPTTTDFQGKRVACLRVQAPRNGHAGATQAPPARAPAPARAAAPAPAHSKRNPPAQDLDDEIPF